MRLTKEEIEGRKQSIKICREDGRNGFFIPFPELEEMLDQLLQREQDVADLVEALERIVVVGTNEINERIGDAYSPDGWRSYTEVSDEAKIAAEVLARIREQAAAKIKRLKRKVKRLNGAQG